MLKWIFNLALLYLVYRLIKGFSSKPSVEEKAGTEKQKPTAKSGDELVEDPQCGVYTPKSTAIKGANGHYFCSTECAEAYKNSKE